MKIMILVMAALVSTAIDAQQAPAPRATSSRMQLPDISANIPNALPPLGVNNPATPRPRSVLLPEERTLISLQTKEISSQTEEIKKLRDEVADLKKRIEALEKH